MMTIEQALEYGTQVLAKLCQANARLDTKLILMHTLNTVKSIPNNHSLNALTSEQEKQFLAFIEQRKEGEPTAYIIGYKEFCGFDFFVDKRVVIPQPETGPLIEAALCVCQHMIHAGRTPVVADIGTGCGAIAITLALLEPRLSRLYASDISVEALETVSLNCQRHQVEQRVQPLHGNLLAPLPEKIDVIIANLPFSRARNLIAEGRFQEPRVAFFAGDDGLDVIYSFLIEASKTDLLSMNSVLLLRIGNGHEEILTRFLHEQWPEVSFAFEKLYDGWNRVLRINV